jgi:hypothetical protein
MAAPAIRGIAMNKTTASNGRLLRFDPFAIYMTDLP